MCFRKRVRNNNCEEECCDFMPLSKRINNLHINNGNFCTSLGYQHLKHSVAKQVYILEQWQAYSLPRQIKVKDTVLEKATWKHRMYVSSLFSFLTWNTFSLFCSLFLQVMLHVLGLWCCFSMFNTTNLYPVA